MLYEVITRTGCGAYYFADYLQQHPQSDAWQYPEVIDGLNRDV